MRLGGNLRFTRLILFFPLLCVSFSADAGELWSNVGYFYHSSEFKNGNKTGDLDLSKCDVTSFGGFAEDGDKNVKREHISVDQNKGEIKIHYGAKGNYFYFDSRWNYAQLLIFKVPAAFKDTLLDAFKKSLSSGNCTLANELANQLANGQPEQCDSGQCLRFEDANGSTCTVTANGGSYCQWDGGTANGTNEDGTPRITISPREGNLDDYAGVSETDVVNPDNPSNSGNSDNNGGDNNPSDPGSSSGSDSGSGSSNTGGSSNGGSGTGGGTGTTDGNTSGSMGDGSAGSGDGSGGTGTGGNGTGSQGEGQGSGGTGNGTGGGTGDGEEDKGGEGKDPDMPKLQDFDIRSELSSLKDHLTEKLSLDGLSMPGGSCPSFDISLFGQNQSITIHCDILDKNGGAISAAFLFIWGFMAIRIFLSA